MNETTKILVRGGAVLVSGFVLFIVSKKIIKSIQKNKEDKQQETLQENQQGMSNEQAQTEQVEADSYNPASDLATFESYVHGGNIVPKPYKIDALFNKLTNARLRKLNDAHKRKHGDSLWTHLDDEMDNCGWTFNDCYIESKRRLRSAGL